MNAGILGDEKVDDVEMKRIEQRGIDFVVGAADRSEELFQRGLLGLRLWVFYPLKFGQLAEGNFPTRFIFVARDVAECGLMDEEADRVLVTFSNDLRGAGINLPLIFESDEDVRVDQDLGRAHF